MKIYMESVQFTQNVTMEKYGRVRARSETSSTLETKRIFVVEAFVSQSFLCQITWKNN